MYETTVFLASASLGLLIILCFAVVLSVLLCRKRAKVVHVHHGGGRRRKRKTRDGREEMSSSYGTAEWSGEYEVSALCVFGV